MIAPIPYRNDLITGQAPNENWMSRVWQVWLKTLVDAVESASVTVGSASLSAQSAAISTTDALPDTGASGLFRVSWFLRVTTPATTSSSVAVTVGWTSGSVALTSSGAALTGNTTSTYESGSVTVQADASTAITYATTYSSTGATAMEYALSVSVERIDG